MSILTRRNLMERVLEPSPEREIPKHLVRGIEKFHFSAVGSKRSEFKVSNMEMETHGPAVTNVALGFAMLSPLIGLIIGLFAAWLVG